MKFKRILKLITPITIVSLLLLLIPSYPPVKIINADEDKLVFSVISDVHIKNIATQEQTKFENALKYLNNKYPEMDALLIAGDITNGGADEEYDRFNSIYSNYSNKNWKRIISMGNHDYWNGLSNEEAQNRFKEKTGNNINTHIVLKGYHIITISSEDGECHGTFTDISRSWLKSELYKAKADNPEKPIFLVVHQPIKDTVYGSDEWGNASLKEILKDYPQCIVFAGHSHYALNDERSINQEDFTSVGTSSLSYVNLEYGKVNGSVPPKATEFSQGLVVEVSSNKVKIIPTDFYNKQELNSGWIIDLPINKSNFKYTNKRSLSSTRPYFNKDDNVKATELSYDAVTIDFSTGHHPNFVHSYKIQVWNMDTNKIDNQVYAYSDFYLNKHSERQTVRLTNLNPNTKYKVYIKAIESFGKVSTGSLSTEFTTNSK